MRHCHPELVSGSGSSISGSQEMLKKFQHGMRIADIFIYGYGLWLSPLSPLEKEGMRVMFFLESNLGIC